MRRNHNHVRMLILWLCAVWFLAGCTVQKDENSTPLEEAENVLRDSHEGGPGGICGFRYNLWCGDGRLGQSTGRI